MPRQSVDIPAGWVSIGRVAGAFGIKGEVKLEPHSDFPERYQKLGTVTARWPGGQSAPFRVTGARRHKTHVLLTLEDVTDMTVAEALRGAVLTIPEAERLPLPAGTYYTSDLVGMTVVTTSGEVIGPLTEVYEAPANDVWVTARGSFPAVRQFVKSVDAAARRITVDAIPGTFTPGEEA